MTRLGKFKKYKIVVIAATLEQYITVRVKKENSNVQLAFIDLLQFLTASLNTDHWCTITRRIVQNFLGLCQRYYNIDAAHLVHFTSFVLGSLSEDDRGGIGAIHGSEYAPVHRIRYKRWRVTIFPQVCDRQQQRSPITCVTEGFGGLILKNSPSRK